MPKPIAKWNPARDVWEAPETEGLLCEHLDVYSGTFPTSGTTVAGMAYELPTSAPHTDGSESSSLPTPTVQDKAASGGSTASDVTLTDAVVRTRLGAVSNPRHSFPRPPPGTGKATGHHR